MSPRALLVLVAAAAVGGAARAAPPRPVNVLLITLDAQRADHLGCYGYPRPTSPRIDGLARAGTLFRDALGHTNWTGPGIATLLTGLHPAVHGIDTRHKTMDRHFPTPLKELARRGWRVAGFQSLGEPYVNFGFGGPDRIGVPIAQQLRELAPGPFLLWHHVRHVHLPYRPRPELRVQFQRPEALALSPEHLALLTGEPVIPAGTTAWDPRTRPALEDLYDACVRENDEEVGAALDALQELGLSESTIVVLTADHGEELLEHGQVGHASTHLAGTLYEEILRIPLLMRVPGAPAGRVVHGLAQPIDVMPTVLAALGVRSEFPFQGRSLLPAIDGGEDRIAREVAFAEGTACGWQCPSNRAKTARWKAARGERFKLLVHVGPAGERREALYDLADDPGEKDALAVPEREASDLRRGLARHERENRELAGRLMLKALDGLSAELRALLPAALEERVAETCDELAMLRYVFRIQNPSPFDDSGLAERFRRGARAVVDLLGKRASRYWACREVR